MSKSQTIIRYTWLTLAILALVSFCYITGLGSGLVAASFWSRATPTTFTVPTTPLAGVTATPWIVVVTATPQPADSLTTTPTRALPPTGTPAPASTPAPAGTLAPAPTRPAMSADWDIFWEAWDILKEEFYGDLPAESELPYVAIRGLIGETGDPYTAFLDPVRAEIFSSDLSGSFEGIGATIRLRPDGVFEVVQPLTGYPAIKAGVRAKDQIIQVDDRPLDGMTIYEAISLIRGPAGTTVRLLIRREGTPEPFEIEIRRARIELPVVESKMLDHDIAYIRLTDFGQTALSKLQEALRQARQQNAQALIFDLRGNPGGYLLVSIQVASQFIGDGVILIERFQDGSEQTYRAQPGGLALDIPMVVLVDGGSASASEIVAGAIQDRERGILIGTTTLGKGSVQMVHTLSDGSQLRVTNARWFTPNDRAIHGTGLKPDIEVTVSEEDLAAERDPQLERAIEYLLSGVQANP